MLLRELFQRCTICRDSDERIQNVRRFGSYGSAGSKIYYHKDCVKNALGDPERYRHRQVDAALNIVELCKSWDKEDSESNERRLRRIDDVKDSMNLL